jgi:hypothetical protein
MADDRRIGRLGLRVLGAALVAVFVLSAVLFGRQVWIAAGFPLDDDWIHQVVGRNLAFHGVPSFVPGEAPAGSTSTLWPAIVALNHLLFAAIEPYVFLFVFNIAMTGLSVVSIAMLAAEDGLPRLEAACLFVLPALTGNFLWLATSGMEHSLFVACVLLSATIWLSSRVLTASRAAGAGVILGVAILTRVEALAFVPIFLMGRWLIDGAPRKSVVRIELFFFLAPLVGATLLVLADNLWTSGTVLPVTMRGRRWLYFGPLAIRPLPSCSTNGRSASSGGISGST